VKILILGGSGMLGHTLYSTLRQGHKTRVTLRKAYEAYGKLHLFDRNDVIPNIDITRVREMETMILKESADVVINCVGVIKQSHLQSDPIANIEINALLPHRLSKVCAVSNSRLIHLSTDCVFSGKKGSYIETDEADPADLYGRTKLLGEVTDAHCLTIRTSMIGRELERHDSLLEWFLAQSGTIQGYKKAIFTGFTTLELSRILEVVIRDGRSLSGLYHVSSEPISKYDLLCGIKDELGLKLEIIPDETFKCDRSLTSNRFRNELGYTPPSWSMMIKELCKDIRKEST